MKILKFEKELGGIVRIFEISGLQYFSLEKLTNFNVNQRPSALRVFSVITITTFLICFVILASTLTKSSEFTQSSSSQQILTSAASKVVLWGRLFHVVLTITHSYFSSRDVKLFFLNSREVMQLMYQEFDHAMDLKQTKVSAWKRFAWMSFSTFSGLFFLIHVDPSLVLFLLLSVLPTHYFLIMNVYKFIFFVEMINQQIHDLNILLRKHIQYEDIDEDLEFKIIKVSQVKEINKFVRKLKVARKIYNLIHDNGVLINNSNGLPVLVYIVLMIVNFSLRGFEVIVICLGTLLSINFWSIFLSISSTAAILITTVAYCQKTSKLVR